MTNKTVISPYKKRQNKIYGYNTDQIKNRDEGFVKVGETTKDDVNERILQQTGPMGVPYNLLWNKVSQRTDGTWFSDKDLHRFYREEGIDQVAFERAQEWFDFQGNPYKSEELFDLYTTIPQYNIEETKQSDYVLRPEQAQAVNATLAYYYSTKHSDESREFLWNAKPRFGKTLATYDFMREIKAQRTLIVTNRPAIANSWFDDFNRFIGWRKEERFYFVSEVDALKDKARNRKEFTQILYEEDEAARLVAFVSLQDLKGSYHFGGSFKKLEWLTDEQWDLLVIDEAHEGVDTHKTNKAFENLNRDFTLHLSGTPFKALSDGKFNPNQIYNWTYVDEQRAKTEWDENNLDTNPYASLPELSMFTYQMSDLIKEQVQEGLSIGDESNVDYAFDLNEFFKTDESGKLEHEDDIKSFLDNLCEGNMPFSQTKYRDELNHTFWLLSRVDSAKALEKLLKRHPVFKDYHIIIAAGDGRAIADDDHNIDNAILNQEAIDSQRVARSYDRVKQAIKKHDKTITLSVGQLTTGVTIPEWTAVFMLNNVVSPALYFQAAFRAQNPHRYADENNELIIKERAYVFDFSPDRTLQLYDDFANNLYGEPGRLTDEQRKDNIRELINFFPVIGEDEEGQMVEFSSEEIMILPNRIRSREVVKNGFMSNLLFKNIGNIFSAPKEIRDALNRLPEEKGWKSVPKDEDIEERKPMVDDYGEVEVPKDLVTENADKIFKGRQTFFGDKIYREFDLDKLINRPSKDFVNDYKKASDHKQEQEKYQQTLGTNKGQTADDLKKQDKKLEERLDQTKEKYAEKAEEIKRDFKAKEDSLQEEKDAELLKANDPDEKESIEINYGQKLDKLEEEKKNEEHLVKEDFIATAEQDIKDVQEETVNERMEKTENKKKNAEEMEVRDRLRGFTRTIPSALMAYGDTETTVDNFDENIADDIFLELTSITKFQFQLLRDGWERKDEEGQPILDANGNPQRYEGFFNKAVFNASIQEFFNKKQELSNYHERKDNQTIFDFIPLQKTNQQFTPVEMVRKMVDALEEENPGIFSDPDKTFLDPYAKSGLFVSEIARRLYEGLELVIPDEQERLKHIYENQVYAIAPTNITYNITLNHVFEGLEGISSKNFVEYDLTEASKNGTMQETIEKLFERGEEK